MTLLTLTTERLTLRPYHMDYFDAYAAFVGSERTKFMGGPHDLSTAWRWFTNDTASWPLLGFPCMMITLTETGEAIGGTGLTQGPEFPEPEFGWFLFEDRFEGKGYAFEAAARLRAFVFEATNLASFVSYIDPDNTPSANLATRLGAVHDPDAKGPENDPCLVFRHHRPEAAT